MFKSGASSLLLLIVTNSLLIAEEVHSLKIDGKFPRAGSVAFASGSGVIIGEDLVLTNRHVVQGDDKTSYDGFHIFVGPDYKSEIDARLVAVCDTYDLALLRTKDKLKCQRIAVLDSLPPLSTQVTAFGFPLGSQFGVGLTATGGQVSRHPTAPFDENESEELSIKSALWHDAILASGNSGGPLFSKGVLVGLNFAVLTKEGKHALSVPGKIVGSFIKACEATSDVAYVNSLASEGLDYDPSLATVYIESMSDDGPKFKNKLGDTSNVFGEILNQLKSRVPHVTDETLAKISLGDLHLVYPSADVHAITAGDIARISGKMTLVEISEDIMHVKIGGARFFILLLAGGGGELQAKLGDIIGVDVPIDALFYVGEATEYTTVVGTKQYAILLVGLSGLKDDARIKKLISEERDRRMQEEVERAAKKKAIKDAQLAKNAAEAEARILPRIRRTFVDGTGKHRVEAAAVAFDGKVATIIRLSDNQKIEVPVSRLSSDDRAWLEQYGSTIRLYGPQLERLRSRKSEQE